MVYDNCKIYGPYTNKNKRQHVIIIFPNGVRKTVSYPKYLVELYLDRYLDETETIDHIDGDITNNCLTNLRVINRKQHCKEDVKRLKSQKFVCPECKKEFILEGKKLHDAYENRKKGSAGPFCSKSCAGKYSRLTQLGLKEKLNSPHIIKEYETLKEKFAKIKGVIYNTE